MPTEVDATGNIEFDDLTEAGWLNKINPISCARNEWNVCKNKLIVEKYSVVDATTKLETIYCQMLD